jgi:REP element-mobilizing transposase RayT
MKQLSLKLPTWGGKRRGAGRKRKHPRPQVPHRQRERFRWKPLHVTIRVRREVWNLRTHRCFRALKRSFAKGCARFGFRLVHFSVQGNHIHLVVEAPDHVQLGRAMKGLEVRMARALNKLMRRKGQVFADRYHAHLLRWPREVRFAIDYVLRNRAVHALRKGRPLPDSYVDPLTSESTRGHDPPLVAESHLWLLRAAAQPSFSRSRRSPISVFMS